MKPSVYRKQWIDLRQAAAPGADKISHLSRRIAFSFLDHYIQRDFYEPDYIDLLCEMASTTSRPLRFSKLLSRRYAMISRISGSKRTPA
ncbi:MAG: hypothetical protein ACYSR4_10825 [Planctomycetota bacterium]